MLITSTHDGLDSQQVLLETDPEWESPLIEISQGKVWQGAGPSNGQEELGDRFNGQG